jgi:hypothetical protein
MQLVVDVQETALSVRKQSACAVQETPLNWEFCGACVLWIVHWLPSQCSMSASLLRLPTAVQSLAETHDTSRRLMLVSGGAGALWTVQVLPFQPSTTGALLEKEEPSEMQALGDVHDTAVSERSSDPGTGWIDQLDPSQCSASGPNWLAPTAVQSLVVGHDTAWSPQSSAGSIVFGVACSDHFDRRHTSTNLLLPATAIHMLPEHDRAVGVIPPPC